MCSGMSRGNHTEWWYAVSEMERSEKRAVIKYLHMKVNGVTIPLDDQTEIMLASDIVSETVVVTTSMDEEEDSTVPESGTKEVVAVNCIVNESGEETKNVDSFIVSDVADSSFTRPTCTNSLDVTTTLQHLSNGSRWTSRGMLEDFTRLRDRLKKREQRKNPEYRCRETAKARVRMANRRNNPVLREIERKKDRERRALARQKKEVREKERERDKLYKKKLRERVKTASEVDSDNIVKLADNEITCDATNNAVCVGTVLNSGAAVKHAKETDVSGENLELLIALECRNSKNAIDSDIAELFTALKNKNRTHADSSNIPVSMGAVSNGRDEINMIDGDLLETHSFIGADKSDVKVSKNNFRTKLQYIAKQYKKYGTDRLLECNNHISVGSLGVDTTVSIASTKKHSSGSSPVIIDQGTPQPLYNTVPRVQSGNCVS